MLALALALTLSIELPPEARELPPPPPPAPPSLVARVMLTGAAAVVGVGASLGLAYLYSTGGNGKALDYSFSNAVLAGLLASGLGFVVHQAFGGRGEVVVAMLVALAVMGASLLAATFIDPSVPNSMLITAAIGAIPAAVGTVLCLELTQTRLRVSPAANRGGIGVAMSGEF